MVRSKAGSLHKDEQNRACLLGIWSLIRKLSIFVIQCSVVSNSLQPHGLQHARLPCPSLFPRVCSNSCPLSQWYHPTFHPLCPRVGHDWATEQQHKGSPLSLRFSLILQMLIAPKLALSLFKLIFHWDWKDLQITSNVGEVKMPWSVIAILGCFSPAHTALY